LDVSGKGEKPGKNVGKKAGKKGSTGSKRKGKRGDALAAQGLFLVESALQRVTELLEDV
jgi:hypothetical protein